MTHKEVERLRQGPPSRHHWCGTPNCGEGPKSHSFNMALRVKLLTEHGILPARGSAFAAGYDLCSAYAGVVPARGKALLKTDIAIAVPPGTYGRVAPRSGLTLKNGIDVGAGVIGAC